MDWNGCKVVESDADKMSGAPVFVGTRIPISTLFENLKVGATIDEFLEWFPGSNREQIEAVMDFVAGAKAQDAA